MDIRYFPFALQDSEETFIMADYVSCGKEKICYSIFSPHLVNVFSGKEIPTYKNLSSPKQTSPRQEYLIYGEQVNSKICPVLPGL
ncbi:MAG TPA: hypothetical protein PK564_02975 [bacterium]|jgi:hypothetical protein|nr:hypothetical protein [Candidatus Cloacimonas sp.]HQG79278.1 hypothetical protein [bacterium]